ncbi:hypothetical protein A6E15_19210 [Natrinema saccharevitans]|uniref:Uncharacterized protein n=1 Tax=Natrinema saccharevitans TaxID=301967 RepID=A0A1S8ARC5_9EURY|nr:hypothetical protein [Natrinema saccharevitans]OLZ39094.1 hypothetical protein A6E15_19210 [Natrinema saccharevitans]
MTNDETLQELQDTLDEIKDRWQRGETMELPGPIERARSLAADLEGGDDDHDREDCIRGTVMVEDCYPREELHERALDDAASGLAEFGVTPAEASIRWAMVEDGVLHYKVEHEAIPPIDYGRPIPDGDSP